MKISIITPSFNSEKTIRDTIESVLGQTYNNVEYSIVDGGSTDGTIAICREYVGRIATIISEPDKGIYDAMNKGIGLATGDVIGIINSDDFYANSDVLEKVAQAFKDPAVGICYGDLAYIKDDNKDTVVRYWKAGQYKEWKLNYGWIPPHPTCFVRKEVYKKYGLFRLDLPIAADYEFLLRILKVGKVKSAYLPEVIGYMRLGGESSRNVKKRVEGVNQLRQAWRVNGFTVPVLFIFRQLVKVPQYFRRGKK